VNATMYRPPQVSPDGRWISLSRTGLDLVLVNVASHTQKKLPRPGAPIVAWSPDSCFFAYVPESTTDDNDLYLYDVEAGRAERLLRLKSGEWGDIRNVVWSPDNRFIAFACCFESQATTGDATGQIRRIEVATGQMDTVGEVKTSVASGSQLCWTVDGHVTVDPDQGVRCSYRRRLPIALSPDGTLSASLSPLSPDDAWWTGPSALTVTKASTNEVVWQREMAGNTKKVFWSPDGSYLILDDDGNCSPIWRTKADGTGDVETILEDGFLLDVVLQWQPNDQ